jgi:hypothetical protein
VTLTQEFALQLPALVTRRAILDCVVAMDYAQLATLNMTAITITRRAVRK